MPTARLTVEIRGYPAPRGQTRAVIGWAFGDLAGIRRLVLGSSLNFPRSHRSRRLVAPSAAVGFAPINGHLAGGAHFIQIDPGAGRPGACRRD